MTYRTAHPAVIPATHRATVQHLPNRDVPHRDMPAGPSRRAITHVPFEPPVANAASEPVASRSPAGSSEHASPRAGNGRQTSARIGKYKVSQRLHKGRVSHVMLGSTTGIGGVERQVAIKLLQSRYAHEQRFMDSFLHEERVTGAVQHPNLVQMLDSGECEFGYYMAMEYIKGWSLSDLMQAAQVSGNAVPVGVSLSIVYSVAAGLHYLHELLGDRDNRVRVVHRDVHPANVMITEDGFVKLIDFGDVAIEGMERTQPALLSSVSNYTPPELTSRGNVDRRGDIFSLGILLYELTTGHPARRSDSGDFVPPSALIPDYPPELEDLVMRMINPDPEGRLQSAATLQFAFEDLAAAYATPLSPRLVAQFARRVTERRATERRVEHRAEHRPEHRPERRPEHRAEHRDAQYVERHHDVYPERLDDHHGFAQSDLAAQARAANQRAEAEDFWIPPGTMDQTSVRVI